MLRFHLLMAALLAVLALSTGCGHEPVYPTRVDKPYHPAKVDALRIVLIGDTGDANANMARLRAAVIKERKDVVVVAGDLVYPLAPECKDGHVTPEVQAELDEKVGGLLRDLGSPVLLALGNHDTDWGKDHTAREACLLSYAAGEAKLIFPAATYSVDYGVALLAVLNTNHLTARDGRFVREAFASHAGWRIGVGHHVLKTYKDKVGEKIVARWLKRERITLDVWANGHAHLQQYGVYDGVAAVTSGAAAYPRKRPSCPPKCGPGERFSSGEVGYAVLDITREKIVITFKNTKGVEVYRTVVHKRPATPKAPTVGAEK